jgi:hypothetical protein
VQKLRKIFLLDPPNACSAELLDLKTDRIMVIIDDNIKFKSDTIDCIFKGDSANNTGSTTITVQCKGVWESCSEDNKIILCLLFLSKDKNKIEKIIESIQ